MTIAHGPAQAPRHPVQWWETRWAVALLALLSAVPLLWPDIPPLVDLPGHLGRYRIQLDLAASPELQRFFTFEWAVIGNLGVDLIVQALGPLIGIEPAVKLVVITIPALTVLGLLWVAREVHGRIPPTALFALPFAYNFPFHFGFINFALAMALALNGFALWLRLGRQERWRLRALIFVPFSCLLWLCHAFGWGTLGVLAFSAELVRNVDKGQRLVPAAWRAGLHCLALAPPLLLMLLWRSNAGGETFDWFNMAAKLRWLEMALRDRWMWFDVAALLVVVALIAVAIGSKRLAFSRNLLASTLFLLAVYLLLPRVVFGSAYADMRLAPYIFAVALVAIRVDEGHLRFSRALALAGLAFFLVRTGGTTISLYLYDRTYARELQALDHIPVGAPMVSFVGRGGCGDPWRMNRLVHLPAMATVRRLAFSNDQWTTAGAQLVNAAYPEGGDFVRDPSQIVTENRCPGGWLTIDQALARFPRSAFDHVWMIDPPPHDPRLTAGMTPVWREGSSVLYRVDGSGAVRRAEPDGDAN